MKPPLLKPPLKLSLENWLTKKRRFTPRISQSVLPLASNSLYSAL
jgi:hypothetical protein